MVESTQFQQTQQTYIKLIKTACSIMVCNYAVLNMAIDLGFDKDTNQIPVCGKQRQQELIETVGGTMLQRSSQ